MRERQQALEQAGAQLQQLQHYLQALEEQTLEVERAIESMEAIANTPAGTPTYVPLTSGIYVKARLENNDTVLINAGNNVVTEQTMEQAKTILLEQQEELRNTQEQLGKQFTESYQHYLRLQTDHKED